MSSLAESLKGLREEPKAKKPGREPRVQPSAPVQEITMRRPAGKSNRPDYEKVGLYVRTDLRRNAYRKFEDSGGRDLSDLIEILLTKYIDD